MSLTFPKQLQQVLNGRVVQTDAEWESRPAAVLVPLYRAEKDWHLLFTRRTDALKQHSGQVSFPGGAADADDRDAVFTALRETQEEIGVQPADVQVIGQLDELLTITQYRVKPVVGVIPYPYHFQLNPLETAAIFGVPLHWLADAANCEMQQRAHPVTGRMVDVIFYKAWEGHVIWGATARMVHGMLGLLLAHNLYPFTNNHRVD